MITIFDTLESLEKSKTPLAPSETVLSLARTCKKISNEAATVFFGYNTFEFEDTDGLYVFLLMIGVRRRLCLRNIKFTWHGNYAEKAFKLLNDCVALER